MFIDIDQTLLLLNFRIICTVCYFTNLHFCKHIQVFKTCYIIQTKAHLFGPNKKDGILQKSKCMPILKSEKVTLISKDIKKENVILECFLFAFAHINELDKKVGQLYVDSPTR